MQTISPGSKPGSHHDGEPTQHEPLLPTPDTHAMLMGTVSPCIENDMVENQDLCKRCGKLDMDEILSDGPIHPYGKILMDLGPVEAPDFDPSCSFCYLLSSIHSATFVPQGVDRLVLNAYPSNFSRWMADVKVVLLTVQHQSRGSTNTCAPPDAHYICSTSPPSITSKNEILRPRLIASDRIDYGIIQKWLSTCQQNHQFCERVRTQPPLSLHFIDCETREIVPGDPSYKYAALSYVWGASSSNVAEFSGKAMLLRETLSTIEDAIKVTKKLGVRYLWIDRYCINQHNAKEKLDQVRQMHRIYQGAYVTIVAAAGSDPTYGLPGVSSRPRQAQPSAKVGKHILASLMLNPYTLIRQSVWASRGWTYQEALCSGRRLIFTDQYVYYECDDANWSETWDLEGKWAKRNIFMNGPLGEDPWRVMDYISAYTHRKLTYDSDALNGFLGILRLLEELPTYPISHFWGIPILPCVQEHADSNPIDSQRTVISGFFSGLCWKSKRTGRRRTQFPSWSWTGWTGEVRELSPEYENKNNYISNRDTAIKVLDCSSDSLMDLEAALDNYKQADSPSPALPILHITALTVDLDVFDHMKTDTGERMGVVPSKADPKSPELIYRDVSLIFQLTESKEIWQPTDPALSEPLKGIFLGDCIQCDPKEYGIYFYMLVVRKVRARDGRDEYQRICGGHVQLMIFSRYATMQSTFVA